MAQYFNISTNPNSLLDLYKSSIVKKDEEEKKRKPVASTPRQRARLRASGESINLPKPTVPVIQEQEKVLPLVTQPTLETQGLLTEKEEKKIAKDPITLSKYTKAGDFFARAGGFRYPSPTQEQMKQASPEQLDLFNKQRLAARNKGIGEMLLMLSDALGGKDVAMRALQRQQAQQPKEKSVSEIRSEIINKILTGQKINRQEYNALVAIDPSFADLAVTEFQDILDFTDDDSANTEESDEEKSLDDLMKKYEKQQ